MPGVDRPILEIQDLSINFITPGGRVQAVRRVNLSVPTGKVVGLVGESGSGKTTLISAVMRLLPENAEISGGRLLFEGRNVLLMNPRELRDIRGRRISMIFQDPMTTLNPVLTIGEQMTDVLYWDRHLSRHAKRQQAASMLLRVGIPDAMARLDSYPHEFSGGMRQRVSIAMALLNNPELIIADEPTTALDVSMEAQIVALLRDLQREFHTAILFVSHNLGLVAELCDFVVVMYAGTVIEQGTVEEVFHQARHPYTRKLLACDPALLTERAHQLSTIPGEIPDLAPPPNGCIFASRCPEVFDRCRHNDPEPVWTSQTQMARCHLMTRP
jgi:oligopeptide/dipeptide ABC transporter ATP-binding protein